MGACGNRMLVVGALALVVLTGCSSVPDPTPTPTATATSTPRSTATLKPEATPTPTELVAPDANGGGAGETAFTAESSYDLCATIVLEENVEAQGGTRSDYVAVPFTEAEVVERPDGYFWVWANYSNDVVPTDIRDAAALTCIVGGTVENPHIPRHGSSGRQYRADMDPFYDFTKPSV